MEQKNFPTLLASSRQTSRVILDKRISNYLILILQKIGNVTRRLNTISFIIHSCIDHVVGRISLSECKSRSQRNVRSYIVR